MGFFFLSFFFFFFSGDGLAGELPGRQVSSVFFFWAFFFLARGGTHEVAESMLHFDTA